MILNIYSVNSDQEPQTSVDINDDSINNGQKTESIKTDSVKGTKTHQKPQKPHKPHKPQKPQKPQNPVDIDDIES